MRKELLAGRDISPATFNLMAALSACCIVACGFLVYSAFAIRWTIPMIRVGILALAMLILFFSVIALKVRSRYCALLRMFRVNEISRLTLASAVDTEKAAAITEVKDNRTIEKLKENQEQAIQKTASAMAGQVSRNIGENVARNMDKRFTEQELRMREMMSRIEQILGGLSPYKTESSFDPEEEYEEEPEDYDDEGYEAEEEYEESEEMAQPTDVF